jgi:lipooligosaccharide transport system permease protein
MWTIILSGFFEPVFYLFSIGVGIGALIGTLTVDVAYLLAMALAGLAVTTRRLDRLLLK